VVFLVDGHDDYVSSTALRTVLVFFCSVLFPVAYVGVQRPYRATTRTIPTLVPRPD